MPLSLIRKQWSRHKEDWHTILKATEDGIIDASRLVRWFLAEDSDQVTPAEAMVFKKISPRPVKLAAATRKQRKQQKFAQI